MKFLYTEYFNNDKINRPIETIWSEIESYTNEVFLSDTLEVKEQYSNVDILLPILKYNGKKVKGLIVSRSADYICSMKNITENNFFVIANAMWGSVSKSEKADAYFMPYANDEKKEWMLKTYPNFSNKLIIPYQDADYTNEYELFPIDIEKDIDVFMVSRLHKCKNLDVFLKSLIYINKKYGKKLKAVILTGQKNKDEEAESIYNEMIDIAGSKEELETYIEFIDYENPSNMFMYYSRARLTALTSIFEGKNRSLHESVLCNTPVICFSAFNRYIRGNTPILPEGCGYYVDEFSPEAFGERLYELLNSRIEYNTREIALKHFGRALIVDKIIKSIPYYRENIPDLDKTSILDNYFINEAVCASGKGSYEKFLYRQKTTVPLHEKNSFSFCVQSNLL